MRVATLAIAASIVLGMMSPALAGLGGDYSDPATRDGLFYAWFYVFPVAADLWLWPEGGAQIALAMTVYGAQYLMLFAAAKGLVVGVRVIHDFLRPYRHRRWPDSVFRRQTDGRPGPS
jgi:hypothetical protein